MKNIIRTIAAAGLLAAATAQASEPPVRVNTAGLPSHMKLQVEAAAQQGQTALRHYLQRTRMLGYQLRIEDVVAESELAGTLAKAPKASPRKVA